MINRILLCVTLLVALYGCSTTLSSEPSWEVNDLSSTAKLLVFRAKGGVNRVITANFGSESNYVLALKQSQYSELSIPAGSHAFRVASGGAATYKFEATLVEGKVTCIQIEGNSGQMAAVLVPILLAAVSSFTASEAECPSAEELQSYTLVDASL